MCAVYDWSMTHVYIHGDRTRTVDLLNVYWCLFRVHIVFSHDFICSSNIFVKRESLFVYLTNLWVCTHVNWMCEERGAW